MKKHILKWFAACLGLAFLHGGSVQAQNGYSTIFDTTSPPGAPLYALNDTVIGHDGWTAGTITTGDLNDASVVLSPWGGGNAMYLHTTTGPGKPGTVTAIQDFGGVKIAGPTVTMEAVIGYDFNINGQDTAVTSRLFFGSETNSAVVLGMSLSAGGGLYYKGNGASVTLLPKADVKPLSPYKFTLVLDFEQKVFDLTVTGVKRDDSPFNFTISGVAFQNDKATAISDFRLTQNASALSAYMTSLSIAPIPEASSVALFSMAGFALLLLQRKI